MNEIHDRILTGDPIASAEFATAVLDPLVSELAAGRPQLRGQEVLADAAVDAVMAHIREPRKYDPSQLGLWAYLRMAAKRDLQNLLDKEIRATKRLVGGVELDELDRNRTRETDSPDSAASRQEETRLALTKLRQLIPDPTDRKVAQMMLTGERRTERFASVLGIIHLTTPEQRSEVKRHKDRIAKHLAKLQSMRANDE